MRPSYNNVPTGVQHVDVGVRLLYVYGGYILKSQTPRYCSDRNPPANMLGCYIALRPLLHLHFACDVRQVHPAHHATDRRAADILHQQIAAGLYQFNTSAQVAHFHPSSRRDLLQFARLRHPHHQGILSLDLDLLRPGVHYRLTPLAVHLNQRMLPPLDAQISSATDPYARVRRFRLHLYLLSHFAPPANVLMYTCSCCQSEGHGSSIRSAIAPLPLHS